KAKALTLEWLEKVKLPTPKKLYHRYPHQISGGQKQRVVIAMAMCSHPTILLADEPTTALDVTVQKEVLQLMKSLQEEMGMAMIFITHDLALAAELADEVLVLYKGAMMEYGSAKEVLQNPQNNYTKALLSCRPGADSKGKRLPIVSDFLEGNTTPGMRPNPKISISKVPLLKVRNLRVWFPSETNFLGTPTHFLRAVEDVSFDLFAGEILGLVGESGCGKSTISRTLMGLQNPESGNMFFEGKDLAHLNPVEWRKLRRDVQMIFQDPYSSLNPRLTIGQMLMEPLKVHGIVPSREVATEAARLLDLVQLPTSSLHRYPHEFSGGQRQRIGIARALALRPKLILCDESVSALDISVQAQILNLLKDLQAEFRLSYLFISHDLNVVHYIADRVLVMQQGKVVERGTAEEVLRHPTHPYTKKLVAAVP
ncbi:MAG: ABC transporter ATP-binding protein, partial [Chitinophagaceae bacterium]